MITQKQHVRQYNLLKKKYDAVYKTIMTKGLDANGFYTRKMEDYIKKVTGRKHVFMTSSGTSAITAAIYALDLFGKKVAVGSYNYVACVNQYKIFCKPSFVDCDNNMLIDIDKIPKDCDAVMLVNYWGNIIDYDKIKKKFKKKIIVDCSQSFGSRYKGRYDGFFGDISTFAFGGNKPVGTRGFTGAIATDDDKVAYKIDCAINQGRAGEIRKTPVKLAGFRGTPQEFQCGMLSVGMKHWKKWLNKRVKIARKIINALKQLPLRFIQCNTKCDPSYYKLALEVQNAKKFIKFLQQNKIDAQVTYIDDFNYTWGTGVKFPMTQRMIKNVVGLPISPFFYDKEVEKIIRVIKKYFHTVDK